MTINIVNTFCVVMAFLYGVCIGSFLNVVIYRMPLGISIYKRERSFCPHCEHQLSRKDLVPLFSFLFLKGRCRYCGEKISPRYPIFEALTGISFVLCYLRYGLSWYTLIGCILMCILICVAMIDYDTMIVYDRWHFIIIALAVASYFANPQLSIANRLIGSVTVGAALFLLAFFTGGVGYGDVKLLAALGLILGWKLNWFAFLGGYVLATVCLLKSIISKKVGGKTEIPMVPYFSIMSAVAFLYGNDIINWYVNTFIHI